MILRSATLAGLPFACALNASAGPDTTPAPIEPAARGMMQCYSPDSDRKTCRSMAAYRVAPGGDIENVAQILLGSSPEMVMEIISPVTIRSGQICGYVRGEDIDHARISLNGTSLPSASSETYRTWARGYFEDILEREVCTSYQPDGGAYLTRITVDAIPWTEARQRVIWVSPGDGWRVGR